jgi:hypothetical protein
VVLGALPFDYDSGMCHSAMADAFSSCGRE